MMIDNSPGQLRNVYFFNATIYGLKHVFLEPGMAGIALGSLDLFRNEGLIYIYAYTVMPSMFYAVIKLRTAAIQKITEDFDTYTSDRILKQLLIDDRSLLHQFLNSHKNNRNLPSIWQGVYGMKIQTTSLLEQRFDLIHNAVMDDQWHLAKNRSDYRYSSACFYDQNMPPLIPVDDFRTTL